VTVALPLLPPKHETLVCPVIAALRGGVTEITTAWLPVHPFASVTVTVYVPEQRLVIVWVVRGR